MSMDSDRELARLWRVSKTVHEMIRDRGYEVADYEINMSFDDFKETYGGGGSVDRGRMAFHANHSRDSRDRIYVFFCAEEAVSKATYKSFVTSLDAVGAKRGLIVHGGKLTSGAAKTQNEMQSEYHLEDFKEADLLVNITRHFLVPKHTIMEPEEKSALIKRYAMVVQPEQVVVVSAMGPQLAMLDFADLLLYRAA
ncbi:DNA-directed RNA polymerases ii 24 kda polypeptide [Trichosporon asahii var. asahii CBS 8904]|uniref:DNA-directed RNA polymerases I, II, and III subunit RPABC1 n=2 Tax=Trichosporon asahii var. asahii TaxID=189963 RepID=K1VY81_TRIAC|nr:DNA-directed RNA polymerases ii 24 kda polypeptide [Trichosporon asahii var. asahii CBS 2479]EJT46437.1 DNA-directed RNA polymerases ii 24 kda polypeptide [Trichosporon asahii var. asahii CBS 2479]EKD04497.1 DNA-directed RNA polymerases ii 24 kda polypeptide [Trichosporon asahii var. asahii CBS 8904]